MKDKNIPALVRRQTSHPSPTGNSKEGGRIKKGRIQREGQDTKGGDQRTVKGWK